MLIIMIMIIVIVIILLTIVNNNDDNHSSPRAVIILQPPAASAAPAPAPACGCVLAPIYETGSWRPSGPRALQRELVCARHLNPPRPGLDFIWRAEGAAHVGWPQENVFCPGP